MARMMTWGGVKTKTWMIWYTMVCMYTIGLLTSSTSLADGDEIVRMPMDNQDYEAEDSDEDETPR